MNLKEKAHTLKLSVPALYLCLKDSRTPLPAKILAGITVGYAVSPVDLIPDFIPILGYLDDLILLPALVILTLRLIPKELYELHYQEAKELWTNGRPKKWYCAIPILLIWLVLFGILLKIAM